MADQSRILGFAGSVTLLVFLLAVLYSLLWRKRIYGWAEKKAEPLVLRLPETIVPYVRSGIKVLAAALLWCFGYRNFGRIVLHKIWYTGAAIMAIVAVYHLLSGWLGKWAGRVDKSDEAARRKVRSALYFAIFDEFKKTGIEIPFPQRDIHIRSTADPRPAA